MIGPEQQKSKLSKNKKEINKAHPEIKAQQS
jgi:hypothetical protein